MSLRRFAVIAIAVTLLVAGVLSWFASRSPDGLEHVARVLGFAETAQPSGAAGSPLADYRTQGVEDSRLSGGIAGVLGVIVTGLLMGGLVLLLRRRHPDRD
ncbi:PDGLE domain-containing protein [Intrasporangium sp. DVR]|uniref:PDGLE domain-containing protein n=1 Tax=Intrasporangium sp. DVR TaxID=3127867 RepID=UPI00313A603C